MSWSVTVPGTNQNVTVPITPKRWGSWDGSDEWYKKAMASGYYFSDWDLEHAAQDQNFANEIYGAKDDYANATTDEAKALAHARGEAARKPFLYSGGGAGDEYNPFTTEPLAPPEAPPDAGNDQAKVSPADSIVNTPTSEVPTSEVPTSAVGNTPAGSQAGSANYWENTAGNTWDALSSYQPFSFDSYWTGKKKDAYEDYSSYQPFSFNSDTTQKKNAAYDDLANFGDFEFDSTWDDERKSAYGEMKEYPEFTYEKYQQGDPFQHSGFYTEALDSVRDYQPFEYDYTTDPLYGVYKKEYTREGQRASQDALAQAAAMTGGVPSSYANTAAQQAGNYYAAQIADKIPELRQQAYNEWQGNYNNLLNRYQAAAMDDKYNYGIWSDAENRNYQQYLDDRNMDYGLYKDKYGRILDRYNIANDAYIGDRNQAYTEYRDKWGRLKDVYGIARDEENTAYGRALDEWSLGRDTLRDRYDIASNEENTDYGRALDEWQLGRDVMKDLDDTAYGRYWNTEQRDWQRDWDKDERDYNRNWNEDERDYNRNWNEDERDYNRNWNEDERSYNRAWNEDERSYNRNWNEDERDYNRGWNERAYQDQRSDIEYERKQNEKATEWEHAITAMGYSDPTLLEALGVDVSKYVSDQAYQEQVNKAVQAAQYGDYHLLAELDIDTSYLEAQKDADLRDMNKPDLTLSQVETELKNGNRSPNVLAAWRYYMGSDYNGEYDPSALGSNGSWSGLLPPPEEEGGDEITYNDDHGKALLDASASNPSLAKQYLLSYWGDLSYLMKFSLLQNAGFDDDTANKLARGNALTTQDFEQYLNANEPAPMKSAEEFHADDSLLLQYGTYDNYTHGRKASSSNGGYGTKYGGRDGYYDRAKKIMNGVGNDINAQKAAAEQVVSMLGGASEEELTLAGMTYILQALKIDQILAK